MNAGQKFLNEFFGTGWHPIEGGHRWMEKIGFVTLSAPPAGATYLEVTGNRAADDPRPGQLHLSVSLNGLSIGTSSIPVGEGATTLRYPLQPFPTSTDGQTTVKLELDRSFSFKGDTRDLGLAFGTLQWK